MCDDSRPPASNSGKDKTDECSSDVKKLPACKSTDPCGRKKKEVVEAQEVKDTNYKCVRSADDNRPCEGKKPEAKNPPDHPGCGTKK